MGLKPVLPQLDCWMSEMTDHFGVMVVSQKNASVVTQFWPSHGKSGIILKHEMKPFWEPLLTIIYGEVGQSSRCNLTQLGLLLLTPETGPLRILWPYGLGPNLEKQQKMPWISQNTRKNGCTLQFERVPHRLPSVPTGGWEKHGRDGIPCASNLSIKGGQRSTDLGTATSTAWDLNKKGP